MTDKVPPKPKKKAAADKPKVPGPKMVDKEAAGIGHNSEPLTGEKNPEAIKLVDELLAFHEQKKAIAKAERDIRNKLKSQFKILASSVSREMSLRKLDADVRVQVETNHEDFKKLLGYQPQLDFVNGLATEASQKAQASDRSTTPKRGEPQAEGEGQSGGFKPINNWDEGKDKTNVIEREG